VQAREAWESYGHFVRSAKPEERIAFAANAKQRAAGVTTWIRRG
jgi:hypothetical protein